MPRQAYFLSNLRGSFLHSVPDRWQSFLWRTTGQRAKAGYLFHGDTIPFRHPSHCGSKYALLLVDDYSRKKFISFMPLLSQTVQTFKNFISRMESEFGREKVVAQMRTDSASYFAKSTVLQTFCQQKGIYQIYSPPYTR